MQVISSGCDDVAIVTGAGSGIGRAVAEALAASGTAVALVDLPGDGLDAVAGHLRRDGARVTTVAAGVTDEGAIEDAVTATEAAFGPLTLAVNAAGIADAAPAESLELERFTRLFDVNVTGVFVSCRAEARAMLRHGSGSIVNVASISGIVAPILFLLSSSASYCTATDIVVDGGYTAL